MLTNDQLRTIRADLLARADLARDDGLIPGEARAISGLRREIDTVIGWYLGAAARPVRSDADPLAHKAKLQRRLMHNLNGAIRTYERMTGLRLPTLRGGPEYLSEDVQ